jgi:putative ABC transport system permease protein
MTRHVAKLIWNRKRQNALLLLEMICAFLVLTVVTVFAMHVIGNTRQPLGFTRADVWDISVGRGPESASTEADRVMFRSLFAELRQLPQVEHVTGAFTGPYINSSWGSGLTLTDGRQLRYSLDRVTDEFLPVMRLSLVEGRWFSAEDVGATSEPIVVNRRMAVELFGETSAIGKTIDEDLTLRRPDSAPELVKRVVGVVDEFRQFGELGTPENYVFFRMDVSGERRSGAGPGVNDLPSHIFLKLKPGTTAAFEETLMRRIAAVAPEWSFNLQSIDAIRETTNRQFLVPIIVLGLVAGALLLMVALGLTGVVWQSVTQRTQEFGLRRATGATMGSVRGQVVAELLVLATLAVVVGSAIAVQTAFLPLPSDFSVPSRFVFTSGLVLSILTIYGVTALCGWYPSRLATRLSPADALHYE